MRDYTQIEYLSNEIVKLRDRKLKKTNNNTNNHKRLKSERKLIRRVNHGQTRGTKAESRIEQGTRTI